MPFASIIPEGSFEKGSHASRRRTLVGTTANDALADLAAPAFASPHPRRRGSCVRAHTAWRGATRWLSCALASAALWFHPRATATDSPGTNATVSGSALPVPRSEWRMELIAQAPAIRHPSVVCTAPDGRVFVAEDPMDISTDRADEKRGRIVCIHPDGSHTAFAEGLHAVFGMKYLEGRLYVLHNPKFSVFIDGGRAAGERVDLIESTNPEPWAKEWNDHIPANFVLGMDGYFYIAVGDKGLYGAAGRDGKRVDLHGGGVVRIRPDGTELEVYARGLRNILDVALSDEDDAFTYDNTDENQWMSRLSHIVESGYYGYPYDFHPRQPFILWCMADYGAGAATAAFIDSAGALPGPNEKAIFLADFGKRQVFHARLERSGATFRALDPEDLFPDPPGDFRPVGICPSEDGASIYICDWQHRDNKEKVTVGRVFRLTHRAPQATAPRPDWHIAAASGKAFTASSEELLAALSHPNRAVRLTAQRRLSDRGQDAAPWLVSLLQNPTSPALARCHALWALDAIDGGESARPAITAALYSLEPSLRRQAARQLGTRRVRGATEELSGRLADEEPSVRLQAVIALGRIADIASYRAIREFLETEPSDEFLRFATITTLNKLAQAHPAFWPRLVSGLGANSPRVREAMPWVFRDTHDTALVNALSDYALRSTTAPESRVAAARVLADLHRKIPEWKGEWWAYHPVHLPRPVKSVDWESTPVIADTLRLLLQDSTAQVRKEAIDLIAGSGVALAGADLRAAFERERDPQLRGAIIHALGLLKDTAASPLILASFRGAPLPEAEILTALEAAERVGTPSNSVTREVALSLARYLDAESPATAVAARCLRALGQLSENQAVPAVERRLGDARTPVAIAALEAWTRLDTNPSPALLAALRDPRPELRRSAVQIAGASKVRDAIPLLLPLLQEEAHRDETFRALAAMPDMRSFDVFVGALTNRNFGWRELASRSLHSLRDAALPALEKRSSELSGEQLTALQKIYDKHSTATQGPLFARRQKGGDPEDYLAFALAHDGDPGKGQTLFANPDALGCVKCHRVAGAGGDVGPDLSQIGAQFDRKSLAESVLWPSRVVREGYQQTVIELKDGDSIAGLNKGETADSIALREADGKTRTIAKADIALRSESPLSLMPEGLQTALSLQEFTDLIAYLAQLKPASRADR
ncbi:MAG: HEAT repeat domain-containing protein [Verrucomicrobia bacterium]|nr:HEAT repeat domain-containing protein [Verrucomicrobiota bacterium]